jgi:two-component system NtrC family sensor kinase
MILGIKRHRYNRPIIVTTKKGSEQKAIEAFRLGATDFITKPLRPPELVASVERALEGVQSRQEKDELLEKVQTSNQALETKVKELTMMSNIGRLLTSMHGIDELFGVVMDSMLDLTGADYASVLLRDDTSNKLTLSAGKNLTLVMQEKLGEEIRDELAELVLTSQEPVAAAGEGLQRFKLSREIRSVVYAPMVAHKRPIGVLTVGNHKKRTEFEDRHAQLLKAMADYVAVGITNAKLFSTLDMRARNTEQALRAKDAERNTLVQNIQARLTNIDSHLAQLSQMNLSPELKAILSQIHRDTQTMLSGIQEPSRPTRTIQRISPQNQ